MAARDRLCSAVIQPRRPIYTYTRVSTTSYILYQTRHNNPGIQLSPLHQGSNTTPPPPPNLRRQHTPTPNPTRPRPRPSPSQTTIVHNTIIRQHSNHTPAQPLMTDPTNPVFPNNNPPIPPPLTARHTISQQQQSLTRHQLRLPQPGHDTRLVDDAVRAAHAAAEVGF